MVVGLDSPTELTDGITELIEVKKLQVAIAYRQHDHNRVKSTKLRLTCDCACAMWNMKLAALQVDIGLSQTRNACVCCFAFMPDYCRNGTQLFQNYA